MFCALGIMIRSRLGFFLVQVSSSSGTSFHLYHKCIIFSELVKQWWLMCNHRHTSCSGFCGEHLYGEAKSYCLQYSRNALLSTILHAFTVYNTNIFDGKLRAQKRKCQREDAEKKNAFRAFLIHKMSMLTRFDSSIVSKSSCVSCVFGF